MPIPAPSSSLAAAEDLALYLGETFDEEQSARADFLLLLASGTVKAATGREWSAGEHTVYLPATDSQWLSLPPGATVTLISVDGAPVTDHEVVGSRLFRYAGWRSYATTAPVVAVTYTTDGVVPDDVLGAVLAVAADLFENPRGLTSETIDDYTWRASDTERGTFAAASVATVARTYRRRPLTVQLS